MQIDQIINESTQYMELLQKIFNFNWFQNFNTGDSKIELTTYFINSFGSEREDYGTGHELNFICYCCCYARLGYINNDTELYQIYQFILPTYWNLIRKIIKKYKLEPAGAMGSYNVDDYMILPYLLSSAEFIRIQNKVLDLQQLLQSNSQNQYVKQLQFAYELKNKPLQYSTKMLWQIHQVQNTNYQKINDGLLKLYQETVFDRWPVIQHFWFGNLLSFDSI